MNENESDLEELPDAAIELLTELRPIPPAPRIRQSYDHNRGEIRIILEYEMKKELLQNGHFGDVMEALKEIIMKASPGATVIWDMDGVLWGVALNTAVISEITAAVNNYFASLSAPRSA